MNTTAQFTGLAGSMLAFVPTATHQAMSFGSQIQQRKAQCLNHPQPVEVVAAAEDAECKTPTNETLLFIGALCAYCSPVNGTTTGWLLQ